MDDGISAGMVVFDGIITEIKNDSAKKLGNAVQYRLLSGEKKQNACFFGGGHEGGGCALRQLIEVGIFTLHVGSAFVQMR